MDLPHVTTGSSTTVGVGVVDPTMEGTIMPTTGVPTGMEQVLVVPKIGGINASCFTSFCSFFD